MWRLVRGWFVDLRIGTKINGLLLFAGSTLLLVALIGAVSLRQAADSKDLEHRRTVAALAELKDAQRAAAEQQRAVQRFVLAPTRSGADILTGAVASTDATLDAALGRLGVMRLSTVQQQNLTAIVDSVAAWRTVRDEALDAVGDGNFRAAARNLVEHGASLDRAVQDRTMDFLDQLIDDHAVSAQLPPPGGLSSARLMLLLIVLGALLTIALSVLTARTISRPLAEVVDVLERVARGDLSRRVRVDRKDEIGRMGRSLNDTLEVLRGAFDEAHHRATHDALTGTANRTLLRERLLEAQPNSGPGHRIAVLLIDLDGFKQVNDRHGHAAGDRLLVTIGERLLARTRSADTVARIGGDEFVVVLDGVATPEEADSIAGQLLADIRMPVELSGTSVTPGASVGVSIWHGQGSVDELLHEADEAMYAAKKQGKGRVVRLGRTPEALSAS